MATNVNLEQVEVKVSFLSRDLPLVETRVLHCVVYFNIIWKRDEDKVV